MDAVYQLGGVTMKLLTVTVPAYNSEEYLRQSLDSLLGFDEYLDVIIVNDGSTDRTLEIARSYEEKYPELFRVVDKENGGHGSGLNTGIDLAEGEYYYVLDSDDWLDRPALEAVIDTLKKMHEIDRMVDLLLVDTMYEYAADQSRKLMTFKNYVPTEQYITWSDMKKLAIDQYFSMHCMIYRTDILRLSGVRCPEHCFYVDNVIAYIPLPHVKSLYYLPVPLYRYFIGREDQSVNTDVLIRRIDQHILVTKLIADAVDLEDPSLDEDLRLYLEHYFSMLMTINTVHLIVSKDEANYQKKDDLWQWIKEEHPYHYSAAMKSPLNGVMSIPGALNRSTVRAAFKVIKKIYRFS